MLESYINDLTKGLSINTSLINIGSSSGPFPQQEPISDSSFSRTISIEIESPKVTSSKKFVKIDNTPSKEAKKPTPLNSKEDEYKQFSMWVYSICSHNNTIFKSPGKNIYPRMIAVKGVDPFLVGKIAKYGYLDLVYPDTYIREIASLDELLVKEVSKFA